MICENSIDCYSIYINLVRLDAKIFLISKNTSNKSLKLLIKKYHPKIIFKPKNYKFRNSFFKKEIFNDYLILKTKYSKKYKIDKRVSILISTSGTSGNSKFVALSKQNILSNTKSIVGYLNLKSSDQTITTLDLNYSYGFSILNTHIYSGASIVVTNKSLLEKEFWSLYKNNRITNISGVPTIYYILKRLKFLEKYLKNIKFLTAAGGKLDLDIFLYFTKKINKKKKNFYYMYGQTEASPRMSFIKNKNIISNPQSIGKAISKGRFFLRDNKNKKINEPYTEGSLYYSGPNTMLGYVNSKKNLNNFKKNNFLKTGDTAYYNTKKFYFLTGRLSRYIKIDYVRFNLDEIEKILSTKFKNTICSGEDNKLKVFINLKYKKRNLLNILSKTLKIRQNYIKIFFINKIPLLENGKYNYNYLNTKYF